ncbi:Actin-binding FH2 [Penicillium digitatum]|uniref:Uncharacterized protein n=3 Tax=Penicillium digitatum TaxID=36651 RepID=K9GB26_PEND2|nr:hypothetical protein PDIP_40060 [Penicillium digitatum Pd1]EKV15553.1 hypothetical protein PDIP_40060 [Penicillium digitatum Pd1]EKV18322.1 hypothetical protein PDIG_10020 [Penicillium digitatum PHI26]KAG0155459.1 hypothetical protein PDIDSM_1036 [Penicillium digitatum]QQK46622.1 Actin-binding FH2 [Penicillium digitatum]
MVNKDSAGLRKRRLSDDGDGGSSRSPTRRRLTSRTAEPSVSPPPYPILDDNSLHNGGKSFSTPEGVSSVDIPPMSETQVREYHRMGSAYQAWIADPTLGGCPCGKSEETLFDLFNASDKRKRFTCPENHFTDPPRHIQEDLEELGLPRAGKRYRFTRLVHHWWDKDGYKKENEYQHSITKSVLIGESIYRHTGPHWSDVAIAQYKFDYSIDTLGYLYFTNIQNEETLPYVQEILYPRYDVSWPRADRIESHVWECGTEEYREILGTKLGKAAACLVLGAWERGTHHIARVHTLGRMYQIHLRFDIEPLPTSLTT